MENRSRCPLAGKGRGFWSLGRLRGQRVGRRQDPRSLTMSVLCLGSRRYRVASGGAGPDHSLALADQGGHGGSGTWPLTSLWNLGWQLWEQLRGQAGHLWQKSRCFHSGRGSLGCGHRRTAQKALVYGEGVRPEGREAMGWGWGAGADRGHCCSWSPAIA